MRRSCLPRAHTAHAQWPVKGRQQQPTGLRKLSRAGGGRRGPARARGGSIGAAGEVGPVSGGWGSAGGRGGARPGSPLAGGRGAWGLGVITGYK